ncbi:hypothetical protein ACFE04_019732 [Oxalis oulophora]
MEAGITLCSKMKLSQPHAYFIVNCNVGVAAALFTRSYKKIRRVALLYFSPSTSSRNHEERETEVRRAWLIVLSIAVGVKAYAEILLDQRALRIHREKTEASPSRTSLLERHRTEIGSGGLAQSVPTRSVVYTSSSSSSIPAAIVPEALVFSKARSVHSVGSEVEQRKLLERVDLSDATPQSERNGLCHSIFMITKWGAGGSLLALHLFPRIYIALAWIRTPLVEEAATTMLPPKDEITKKEESRFIVHRPSPKEIEINGLANDGLTKDLNPGRFPADSSASFLLLSETDLGLPVTGRLFGRCFLDTLTDFDSQKEQKSKKSASYVDQDAGPQSPFRSHSSGLIGTTLSRCQSRRTDARGSFLSKEDSYSQYGTNPIGRSKLQSSSKVKESWLSYLLSTVLPPLTHSPATISKVFSYAKGVVLQNAKLNNANGSRDNRSKETQDSWGASGSLRLRDQA